VLTFFKDDDVEPVLYIKLLLNLFVKCFLTTGKSLERTRESEKNTSQREEYILEGISIKI